ncbi:hypothetical protein QQ045_004852 [Rhodiola kirilowii]
MLSLAGRLKIKSLTLDWFSKVGVDKVTEFIHLFPVLEELNFGQKGQIDLDDNEDENEDEEAHDNTIGDNTIGEANQNPSNLDEVHHHIYFPY